jgi:AraC-like DNA-binding protein
MHEHPTRAWPVAELAKEAALSRSTFFERFNRAVGVAPTKAKELGGARQLTNVKPEAAAGRMTD